MAMPTLSPMRILWPSTSNSSDTAAISRSASRAAWVGTGLSVTMTANSSPSVRARNAPSSVALIRSAAARNTRSPVECPNTSLTSLKRSRSRHSTAKLSSELDARSITEA
jgi:hypothetical protein